MKLLRQLLPALALPLALVLATPAHAEEPDNRTLITPARTEVTPFDSDRAAFSLDRESLDALQPDDVPDAVGTLPGVSVQRTNRGAGSPILRGLIGPQNLLLIDGVRFNTSIFRTGPNQYAALLDPGALESVELLLGPSSVLYGSDAMGGTIGYRTLALPGTAGLSGHVELAGQSADLAGRVAGLVGYKSDLLSGWARVNGALHRRLRAGGGEEVPMSDFQQYSWATKWGLELADAWRLTAAYLGGSLPDAGRVDGLPKGDVRQSNNLNHFGYVRLDHHARSGFLRELQVTLNAQYMGEKNKRWRCPTDDAGTVADAAGCADLDPAVATLRSSHLDTVLALGLSAVARGHALSDRLQITVGVDAEHEWVGSERSDDPTQRGNFSDGSTYGTAGAFARVEGRPLLIPGEAEIVLSGALRGTTVFASASDVPGLGTVDYDFFGLTGAGSVRILLGDRLNLYASVSQGFRAPNLQETTVLGDTGSTFEIPNADLGPERSTLVEGGAKLFTSDLSLAVSVFRNGMSDAIVREDATYEGQAEVDGKPVVRRVNATEATYRGVETALRAKVTADVTFQAQLSYIDGEVTDTAGDEQAPRRLPPFQGGAGLSWRLTDTLAVGADVRFAAGQTALNDGDRSDPRICGDPSGANALLDPCTGTPGWTSVAVGVTWLPVPDLTLRLRVENLLDQRYRVHGSGYDAAGVNGKLLARYAF